MADLEESIDRVIAGPEKKSRIISQKEKEITAYHESGHALVAWTLPNADPVHKVSIIARGMMGGYTRMLPTEDRHLWSRSQFNDMIAVALAGHAAEQLIFDEMTTGASNDIAQATRMVQRMIMEYGMSEKLGPIAFGNREEMVFLGREIHEQRNYSDETAREIDQEVRAFIDRAYEVTRDILIQGKEKLTELASRLMEQETIEGEDLDKIFADLATDASE
jgi:cell division protease FtsH